MLADPVSIILVKTRFPENIGMAARACANMGCRSLSLVAPELWDKNKAAPLATSQGLPLLENIKIFSTLAEAIKDCHVIFGTTARLGGWRREIVSPAQAATEILEGIPQNQKAAIIFGPEDKGLTNAEIASCGKLIHIKTAWDCGSLNLAQAVLIALYELFQLSLEIQFKPETKPVPEKIIGHAELTLLENRLKKIIQEVDGMQGKNSEYYFLQWHSMLERGRLRRHEFDAFMGLCRQIENKIHKKP